MTPISALLNSVAAINTKYDSIARISGSNFNIFSILKMETNEVRTHSAILAELLNPNGSHDMGGIFLTEFMEAIGLPDFNTIDCKVEVEKYAGRIDENYDKGGRLDLLITGKEQSVIVENKIYAGDQLKQFSRYYNFKNDAQLVYLTLNGGDPSSQSTTGIEVEVVKSIIRLSYERDIILWLEKCKKHAVDHSLLRETITQYINLLKKLTGQTINDTMSEEIKLTLIKDVDSFTAAKSVHAEYFNAKISIAKDFWEYVGSLMVNELGENWSFELLVNPLPWGIFIHPLESDLLGYCIDFNLKDARCVIGIYPRLERSKPDSKAHFEKCIKTQALSSSYNFKTGWHLLNAHTIDGGNIFSNQNLERILPLRNERSRSLAKELVDREIAPYILSTMNLQFIQDLIKEMVLPENSY